MSEQKEKKENQAKPSKRKPSVKRKRLIQELSKPDAGSIAEAGRKAGFAPSTVRSDLYAIAASPEISEAVQKRIDRAIANVGVTPEEVIGSAVFQMRSSIDDVIGEQGGFDLEKARQTGAIDLVKKMEITEKPIFGTGEVERTYKVEMLSNEAGRKEVANYKKVENFAPETPKQSALDDAIKAFMMLHNNNLLAELSEKICAILETFDELPEADKQEFQVRAVKMIEGVKE